MNEPTTVSPAGRAEPVTPDAIMQLGLAFWGSKALLSAVEMRLFAVLSEPDRSMPSELRERLGLHPRGARDFFDALVALGMLERNDGRYSNTPATELFLDPAKPSYMGGILEMANARLYPFWGSLTEGLRTGKPQSEAKTGGDFFATVYADPERLAQVRRRDERAQRRAGRGDRGPVPVARLRQRDRHRLRRGRCPGRDRARARARLTGGGFDLPPIEPLFDAHVARSGLADRLHFTAGDFFADPLPSADVLIMGHILHDWDLDQKRLLLQKAYAALPEGGALIVYDAIIDDDRRENAFGLLMSLNMLIEGPYGFDYTGADCRAWMADAGFREKLRRAPGRPGLDGCRHQVSGYLTRVPR